MLFRDIIGQDKTKAQLVKSVENKRIPHAQLFVTPKGSGALPLAIAYAQYILCQNSDGENITGNEACNLKFQKLMHPDMHFVFPVAVNATVKKHPVSDLFLGEWRDFIANNPYGDLLDWYQQLGIENKQGQIGVDEAESVLITENEDQIINTILSRCQVVKLFPLSENELKTALVERVHLTENEAVKIAHQADGNWNKALKIANNSGSDEQFEAWFITWIRTAFKAKGNAAVIQDLIGWSETIAASGREIQKSFLNYCLQFFRQALLKNYTAERLVFLEPMAAGFDLAKFAPFIHGGNIVEINKEVNDAIYHIERNGNAKIILLDLSIKLTRLLHQKEMV